MVAATAILTFATAALVSLCGGWFVRRTALGIGAVVPTRPDRWHRTPTPTFGGMAIVAGIAAGTAVAGGVAFATAPLLATIAALFGIGWYDDVAPLSALAKMVNSLAVAAFFALTLTTFESTTTHAVLTIAAILWFGGVTNAVNLLDNMDGLAGGVTAIAAAAMVWTFTAELGPFVGALPVALAGALLGFLWWNRHPARLFMGNCGSLAIGGLIAATALTAVARAGTVASAVAAGLILIVPLVDTTFVVLLRRLAGRSTTRGNVDHMSHRLVAAGFSEPAAVGLLYAVGALGAGAGYSLHVYGGSAWPLAAAVAVGVLMMALYLARLPAYAGEDFRALNAAPFAPLLSDLTFRWHAGEVLLDLVLIATAYYAAYRLRFEGEALATFLPGFSMSLPAILGCQLAALYVSGLYSRSWNTFGLHDVSTVLRGVATGCVLSVLAVTYLFKFERFSRGVFLIDAVLLTAAILATRSSFRVIGRIAARSSPHKTRVAIYGAGMRGQLLVREMLANPLSGRNPIAFVDDNPAIRARRIVGVPVRASLEELGPMLRRMRIEEVVLSSPDIAPETETRVRAICAAEGVAVRRLHMEIV